MNKKLTANVKKSLYKYFTEIKPRFLRKSGKTKWLKLTEVLQGLVFGQSCFINTIVENTPHYIRERKRYEKGKRKKGIDKNQQIKKISSYLMLPVDKLISSFLSHLRKKRFTDNNNTQNSMVSIEERVHNQKLCLHDTTDIQKPYAWKMEKLCRVRDGSKSSQDKSVTGKGYLIEGCTAVYRNRLYPLFLSLFSTEDKDYLNDKEEAKKNLLKLETHKLLNMFLHVFDRGYDCAGFMAFCIKNSINFLIRATMNRNVILQSEFKEVIKNRKTQKDRMGIFCPVSGIINKMNFRKHHAKKYSWFKIAWIGIYIKGQDFPKNPKDVLPVNLIAVRIIDKKIKGIEEDIENNKWERDMFFYTTRSVNSLSDAIVVFLCYLLRWKIETYFRYLKQVFDLEKVCVMSFEKIKNLCSLLVIATNFLYKHFHDFEKTEQERKTVKLNKIFRKGERKRDDEIILRELLYFAYHHYCNIKNLTLNPDSYARFIKDLMWDPVTYTKHIMRCDLFDTS